MSVKEVYLFGFLIKGEFMPYLSQIKSYEPRTDQEKSDQYIILNQIDKKGDDILSLDILTVLGHYKRGEYVSTHLHLSAAYVLIADENDALTIKHDENSDVKWIPLKDMDAMSNEAEIIPVYHKLVERAREILIL